jgi:very-short-patch-repair endonuclease
MKRVKGMRSKLEQEFALRFHQLGSALPAYVEQYRFCERKYTFDFAWPERKVNVAVEMDGGNYMVRWSKKLRRWVAVGKHTKSADYEKLNEALLLGWRVLRFTGEMLRKDPIGCIDNVRKALAQGGRSADANT